MYSFNYFLIILISFEKTYHLIDKTNIVIKKKSHVSQGLKQSAN